MPTLQRTVYIGLGGAGIKSISETKKQFLEQYGEVPPMVQFLGIDMDVAEFGRRMQDGGALSRNECCCIGDTNLLAFYEANQERLKWMPTLNLKAMIGAGSMGSGQIRSNGRLAFIANFQRISFALSQAYQNAFYSNPGPDSHFVPEDEDIRFHIVFSLAGGFGSGCFIDLAYMIRDRYFTNSRNLIGYALLPDVYKEMAPSGPGMTCVYPNAYAALQELDYLMHLTSDSEPYTLDWINGFYNEKSFIRNPRPFSWVYLIGNRNGRVAIDSPAQLYKLLGRVLFLSSGSMGSKIEATMDNIGNYAFENGRWTSSLGLSSVVHEGQAVADVFATRLSLEVVRGLLDESVGGTDMAANLLKEVGIYDGGYFVNFLDAIGPSKPAFSADFIEEKREASSAIGDACSAILKGLYEKAEQYISTEGNLAAKLDSAVSRCLKTGKGSVCAAEDLLQQTILLTGELIFGIHAEMASFAGRTSLLKDDLQASAKSLEVEARKSFIVRSHSRLVSLEEELKGHAEAFMANEMEIKRRQFALRVLDNMQETAKRYQMNTLQSIRKLLLDSQSLLEFELDKSTGIGPETELACFFRSLNLSECEQGINELLASVGDKGLEGFTSAEELVTALKSSVSKQRMYRHYQNATLPDAVRDLSREAVSELFYQAMDKSCPLIQYDARLNKPSDSGVAYRILGVEDVERSPFADSTENLCHENQVWTVSTGLKSLILFFTMETPFPIEIIGGMDRWRREYELQEERLSSHIDNRLKEKLENR